MLGRFRPGVDEPSMPLFAAGWLAISAPLLAFPELVWPWGHWPVAVVAVVSLAPAVVLAVRHGFLMYLVAVVALPAAAAWLRVHEQVNALSHFCGVAAGL